MLALGANAMLTLDLTPEQRARLFSMIAQFFQHSELEQAERIAGRIPSYEDYLTIRYGVTGVHMFSLLLE